MSADLVILVPMLGRPHRVAPLLASIDAATPDARVLFLTSPGDRAVCAEIDRHQRHRIEVPRQPIGDYARKINVGYRATHEPYIFTGADDLHFHPGWFHAAMAQFTRSDKRIGVVGTNDLGSPRVMAGDHATHSVVARWYADQGTIDEKRKIYHEGYAHDFVDDELVGTAKKRDAWAFAPDSHVEHLHPNWGKAPSDASYARQGERIRMGRRLFLKRRKLWA